MQNSSFKKSAVCGIINPSISILKPSCVHDLTKVSPLSNPSKTSITPNQTLVTPDHTAVKLPSHTCLSLKQAQVLEHLEKIVSRQTNYIAIADALGISRPAARSGVSGLVKKEYIEIVKIIRTGAFQGFMYKIYGDKCQLFLAEGGSSNPKYFAANYTVTPPPDTVSPLSDPLHTLSSKVYNLENKLTTQELDVRDAEMQWWMNQGLTIKHLNSWSDEFKVSPESLVQSLRSARFDIVVNEIKPKGKPIENSLNWIYAILKYSSIYQRPKNYKSIVELQAEELEDQQQRDDTARKKIWNAEIDGKFKELMNDQESPLFQELLGCVDDFAKDNQVALEISMKELLKEKYPMDQYRSKC